MRIKEVLLVILAAATLSAVAQAQLIAKEQAIEGTTRSLSLPSSEQGVMVAKPCPTCALAVLRMTAETRLYVGKDAVSLAELQKFISTGGERHMVVLWDPRLRTITRILVPGQLPKPKH
jgi:hypothetical protein